MNISRLSLLLTVLFAAPVAFGGSLPEPQQVAPHSYAWIGPYGPPTKENHGFRMNLGFVTGSDSVAIIDSGYSDAMANEMLKQIRRVTDKPVKYVINTNSQPHRILGNAVFKQQGAEIIASADAIPRITGEGPTMAGNAERALGLTSGSIQAPVAPDQAVEESLDLQLGGITLQISPAGTAHTAGSLIVHVKEDNVIYAGDVLYGGRLLAILPVSRTDGWIEAFDKLRAFDQPLFIPGHGSPGQLADFEDSTYKYLTTLKTHMDQAIEQGTDLQEASKLLDQSNWGKLADFDALSGRNAHQTYLEREAASFQ